jgi:hypothetical protein
MAFSPDVDFCCLALRGPHLAARGAHTLLPGLTVSNSQAPLDLDKVWVNWLGSLQADEFRRSSLFIVAQRRHRFAGGDETVRVSLENRVRLLHNALVLQGCGYNSTVLMISGNTSAGHLHIGPVSPGLTPSYCPIFRRPDSIAVPSLERAAAMLTSLEHVYEHVPGPHYRRIRKGFNLWIKGAEEGLDFNEKLNFFVRAAEAIIRPTIARRRRKGSNVRPWRAVTETFKTRGQTFIGQSKRSSRLLQEFYEIRSSIAHVQDVLPKVRKLKGVSSKDTFLFRALQCEVLASAIYTRIFTNDALRERLRTERGVEGFWRRSDAGRGALWGDCLDLNARARRVFVPFSAPSQI